MANNTIIRRKKLIDLTPEAIERLKIGAKSNRLFLKPYMELLLEKIAKQAKLPKV